MYYIYYFYVLIRTYSFKYAFYYIKNTLIVDRSCESFGLVRRWKKFIADHHLLIFNNSPCTSYRQYKCTHTYRDNRRVSSVAIKFERIHETFELNTIWREQTRYTGDRKSMSRFKAIHVVSRGACPPARYLSRYLCNWLYNSSSIFILFFKIELITNVFFSRPHPEKSFVGNLAEVTDRSVRISGNYMYGRDDRWFAPFLDRDSIYDISSNVNSLYRSSLPL